MACSEAPIINRIIRISGKQRCSHQAGHSRGLEIDHLTVVEGKGRTSLLVKLIFQYTPIQTKDIFLNEIYCFAIYRKKSYILQINIISPLCSNYKYLTCTLISFISVIFVFFSCDIQTSHSCSFVFIASLIYLWLSICSFLAFLTKMLNILLN